MERDVQKEHIPEGSAQKGAELIAAIHVAVEQATDTDFQKDPFPVFPNLPNEDSDA